MLWAQLYGEVAWLHMSTYKYILFNIYLIQWLSSERGIIIEKLGRIQNSNGIIKNWMISDKILKTNTTALSPNVQLQCLKYF